MSRSAKPACTFRIYASKSLFYRVIVWRKQADLRKHCSAWVKLRSKTMGLCTTHDRYNYSRKGTCRISAEMGEIHILDTVTTEILAHECVHALFGWMERMQLGTSLRPIGSGGTLDINSDEEKACYAYGKMFSQAVGGLYRKKIWR